MHIYIQKTVWAINRIALLLMFVFMFTGIGIYLCAPYISYFYFGSLRFWRFLKLYPSLVIFVYKVIWAWLRGDTGLCQFITPLTAPPRSQPDLTRVRPVGNCSQEQENYCFPCVKCCTQLECPLLDRTTNQCLAYNSPVWRYLNCGPFPSTQEQLEYYQCPKWVFIGQNTPDTF